MQKILSAVSLAAGIGLLLSQSANAVPVDPGALNAAATTASPVQQVQYDQYRTRHGVVKCYRDLVIGPYRCHRFRNGVLSIPF